MNKMGIFILFLLFPLMVLALPGIAYSFSALDGFDSKANALVRSLAVQADRKLLIGGLFNTIGGVTRTYIARLNPDGTLDEDFNPNANDLVYSVVVQADGKVLIGGGFTTIGGVTRNHIARLNPDGTLDTEFDLNVNNWVYSLAVQADGKILVGGGFTTMGGVPRNCIARLNPDGMLDPDFDPNAHGGVEVIAIQPDGNILIGGDFHTIGGVTKNYIARLNPGGSLDNSFSANPDNFVRSVNIQTDGKILVGGFFNTIGGGTMNYLARLNPDGTLDAGFNPNPNNFVYSIALQTDRKILVGGDFTTMDGVIRNHISRLNPDGSLDPSFSLDANYGIYSITLQDDGKVLIGGDFTTIDGATRNYIARITNTDAALQEVMVSKDGSTIIWERNLASPEVWRVTFEESADGVTWTNLGNSARILGGWQMTGLSLPFNQNIYIRARGYGMGGIFNASGSLFESVRLFYLKPTVPIIDFNGDGKPDIVWRNTSTGRTTIWYMDGANWSGESADVLPQVSGLDWNLVGVADFNNDTKPDLVWRNALLGRTTIWYMDGGTWTGEYQDVLPSVSGLDWSIVGIADFNGDSYPDLIWRNATTGRSTIWYMDGASWSGGYADVLPQVSGSDWNIVGVADFNYDTKPDLIWRNATTGRTTIWYMDGANWSGGYADVQPTISDPNWQIVAVRDFNNDGNPDLLWRNTATYRTTVWYMNGATWSGNWADLLPVVSDPNWAMVGR